MRRAPNLAGLIRTVRSTWSLWAMALAFVAGIFFAFYSLTKGANALIIAVLLAAGIVGGALVRLLARENLVAVLFALIVVVECVILSQLPKPWSNLWPIVIPSSAIGVMIGHILRETLRESRAQIVPDPPATGANGAGDV